MVVKTWVHFVSKEPSETRLGPAFEASWAVLGRPGGVWGCLRASLDRLGSVFGRIGAVLARLRGVQEPLCSLWDCLGVVGWGRRRIPPPRLGPKTD